MARRLRSWRFADNPHKAIIILIVLARVFNLPGQHIVAKGAQHHGCVVQLFLGGGAILVQHRDWQHRFHRKLLAVCFLEPQVSESATTGCVVRRSLFKTAFLEAIAFAHGGAILIHPFRKEKA